MDVICAKNKKVLIMMEKLYAKIVNLKMDTWIIMVIVPNVNKIHVNIVVIFMIFVKNVLIRKKIKKNFYLMVNVLKNVQMNILPYYMIMYAWNVNKVVKNVIYIMSQSVYNVKIVVMKM